MPCSRPHFTACAKTVSLSALLALTLAGCANLPYSPKTEAAVAGAAAGAAASALLTDDEGGMGTIVGALAGAGLGYVLASETDWFTNNQSQESHHHHSSSSHKRASFLEHLATARVQPATVASVYTDNDADLNGDGLVTMDEIVAMAHSDLSEDQVIARLKATEQVFFVSASQRQRLMSYGVSRDVVAQLEALDQASTSATSPAY